MKNVLLIGAGSIAGRHIAALHGIEDVTIAGVCDLNHERAAKLAEGTGAAVFTDAAVAIEAVQPDYSTILTPCGVREAPIRLCIERKIPFLVEKPPCDSLQAGKRLADEISAAGILHSVGFMHRWHAALNTVLEKIQDETISIIRILFTAPFAVKPVYDNYPDPYLVERSGGLVGDQGVHYVDIARYIARAEVAEMKACGVNRMLPRSEKVTTCDTAGWLLRMENNILVQHAHTWCGAKWECLIEIVTDQSRVEIDMFGNRAKGILCGKDFIYEGKVDEFELEHRGFLAALEAGDMTLVRSPYSDALESFRVVEEINRRLYADFENS